MQFRKTIITILSLLLAGFIVYYVWPVATIPDGVVIDKIVVHKSRRLLLAYSHGKEIVRYTISLGKCPVGKKEQEGDFKTPEGSYTIFAKNPNSAYHLNLGISYPNAQERKHAQKTGKAMGGDIKIHGLKNGLGYIGRFQRWKDWTNGCIALTNEELDELFHHTPQGTPIEIRP